jgi:hypothetical protein
MKLNWKNGNKKIYQNQSEDVIELYEPTVLKCTQIWITVVSMCYYRTLGARRYFIEQLTIRENLLCCGLYGKPYTVWPKHVADYFMYKRILVQVCAFLAPLVRIMDYIYIYIYSQELLTIYIYIYIYIYSQ